LPPDGTLIVINTGARAPGYQQSSIDFDCRGLTMKSIVTVLALSGLMLVGGGETSRAEITYPWCAQYGGGLDGGGRNCGFWTYQQCLAAISGMGGYCMANPMYQGPQPGMIQPPGGRLR
jgi:hypothetical protein